MKRLEDDLVSASEIAQWAWCPEAWRLESLGAKPENRAAIERGERHHAKKASFERVSRSATSLGWWLLAGAVLVALLAVVLVRG